MKGQLHMRFARNIRWTEIVMGGNPARSAMAESKGPYQRRGRLVLALSMIFIFAVPSVAVTGTAQEASPSDTAPVHRPSAASRKLYRKPTLKQLYAMSLTYALHR